MNDETTTTENTLAIVEEQINILLAYLERPDVQLQIIILVGITILSYVLAIIAYRGLVHYAKRYLRGRSEQVKDSIMNRWIPALDQLDFPLIALLLIYITIPFVETRGNAVGLLFLSTIFYWVLMAYQVVLTLLYAVFRRKAVRRYHKSVFAPAFVLIILWGILSFLNIDEILQIQLGLFFETSITLGNLISAFLVLYVFIVFSRIIQDVLRTGFSRFESDPGLVNSILTITRYLVMVFGVVITLTTLGFSPATLAAIAGGLSLGAGLGLQRIVGNFFSGIILLLEQSVRPGDVVTIGNDMGVVQKITIRSTIVNRLDNVDLVIPNENLITSTVTTYNTPLARKRVEVHVGASYDAEPTHVRKVLESTAAKHGLVLDDPAPTAYFLGFGNNSLNFVLWAWVSHNDYRWSTQSDLHYMVSHAFKEHGIVIPYPQRDIHIHTAEQAAQQQVSEHEGNFEISQPQPGAADDNV